MNRTWIALGTALTMVCAGLGGDVAVVAQSTEELPAADVELVVAGEQVARTHILRLKYLADLQTKRCVRTV